MEYEAGLAILATNGTSSLDVWHDRNSARRGRPLLRTECAEAHDHAPWARLIHHSSSLPERRKACGPDKAAQESTVMPCLTFCSAPGAGGTLSARSIGCRAGVARPVILYMDLLLGPWQNFPASTTAEVSERPIEWAQEDFRPQTRNVCQCENRNCL